MKRRPSLLRHLSGPVRILLDIVLDVGERGSRTMDELEYARQWNGAHCHEKEYRVEVLFASGRTEVVRERQPRLIFLPILSIATMTTLLPLLLLLLLLLKHAAQQPDQIFDNVLSEDVRLELHEFCSSWDNRDVVFEYPFREASIKYNLIEQTLHQMIEQLYNLTRQEYYVEYWTRQKWVHIVAHADIDEGRLPLRNPLYGHVLYLQVGDQVKGPTCVFDKINKGGDLLHADGSVDLYVCPAKLSRLLQFNGSLLHAVPRPADLWLFPTMDRPPHTPESAFGRSVLIFNLWPKEWGPLLQRTIHPTSCTDDNCLPPSLDADQLCHNRSEWIPVDIHDATSDVSNDRIEFPIMGDPERRGSERRSIVMATDGKLAKTAFEADDRPSILSLYAEKRPWFSFMGIEF